MIAKDRWNDLMQRMNCNREGERLFMEIERRYSESHRVYHTLRHISSCLDDFDQCVENIKMPDQLELAIWLHDIIYEPRSFENEQRSSDWAITILPKIGITYPVIGKVAELILATRHNIVPTDIDAMFMVDIDLAILGSRPEIYTQYEHKIRKEYQWIPELIYLQAREQLLESLLDRKYVYTTSFFRDLYENQVRANLQHSINIMRNQKLLHENHC